MEPWESQPQATHSFSDQLNIATPEQVELHFPIAGIGSRFVATLVDHLIIGAVYIALFLIFFVAAISTRLRDNGPGDMTTAQKWFLALIILFVFSIQWGYFALFEGLRNGQTPGKSMMKLRVIKDSGRQITFFEALARNLLRIVDYFPSMYLTGVITMLCNRRNKRLGDFAAGTLVIHERADEQPLLYTPTTLVAPETVHLQPWAATPSASTLFPADAIARLDANDLRVIETFFARALDLPIATRAEVAARIASQLSMKMQAPLPEGNPERALEAIAHTMRGGARY